MIEQLTHRYRVLSLLGQGGMGCVYLAEDLTNGSQLALKTLAVQQATDPEDAARRFRQEFRAMARLRHPNLVEVYDFGTQEDGTPFFTMEVVPGDGLDALLPLSPDQVSQVLAQLAQALAYIHQQGLVHCDIKPENIRLRPDGRLKLMDFGLMGPSGQPGGGIKGTLAYMSPEVARGAKLDARSDLYSVGALAYHLLTGRVPFEGDDPVAVLRAHLEETPDPITPLCPQVSPELEAVVLRLLAKDPLARFQSCHDLLAALGVAQDEDEAGMLGASPFVGRHEALAAFNDGLEALSRDERTTLAFTGAPGLGKTRLLEELRFQAQLAGRSVLSANCQEEGAPYAAFVPVLRAAVAALSEEARAPFCLPLSSLLPELMPDGRAVGLDPQKEKARLQGAVVELFATLSRAGGLVLLLDDWHWADASSQELLGAIATKLAEHPLLLVTAGREEAAGALPLPSLAPAEVREMTEAILGHRDLADGFVSQLEKATHGNPLFVESALRHLHQEGLLRRRQGRWQTEGLSITAAELPSSIHDLLLRRIERLSPLAIAIAEVAAVMGQPFPTARLLRLVACDEDARFEALAQLAAEGVLREDEGMLRFIGGQFAELLYARLDAPARISLHTRVADVLAIELSGDDRLEALFELARHQLSSDAPARGVPAALAAARKSLAIFGLDQARTMLEAGLPHATEAIDRLGFLQGLGDLARFSSELDAAAGHYQEALAIARALGGTGREASLLYSLGILHQVRSQYDEALARMEEALAALAEHPDPAEGARVRFAMGRLHNFKGDSASAVARIEEALAIARERGDQAMMSSCLGLLGLLYVQGNPERVATGLAYLDESRAVKERLGDKPGLNDTFNLLGNAQMSVGRYADALASFDRTLVLCRELGIRDDEICAEINLGMACYELGRFAQSARHAHVAAEGAAASGNPLYEGIALVVEAVAHGHLGAGAEAAACLKAAEAVAERTRNAYLDVTVASYAVEVELLLGRLLAAQARAEAATALSDSTGIHEYDAKLLSLGAELEARFGDTTAALAQSDRLAAWAEENQAHGARARAFVARAWALRVAGEATAAVEALDAAIAGANSCGAAHVEGVAHWLRAEALGRLGNVTGAREAFEQAARLGDSARLALLATFGRARLEGRSAEAYRLLAEARGALETILSRCSDEAAREDLLSLDELWRVQRGDLSPAEHAGAGAADGRYLAALKELEAARAQLVEARKAQAVQAQTNLRLDAEREAHARQLEMLNTLARTVSTTLVLAEVIDNVVDFTLKLTGADRCFILLTEDGEQLRFHHAKDRAGNVLTDSGEKVSGSITQRVLATLEAECVLDTKDHAQFQAQQSILDLNLRTVMCVPLMVKQEPLGVLYVDSQAVVNAFGPRDLDLLQAIASQASVAIQNAKLYERATVDGLTRLFVRSYFEQRLASEVRRAQRYGSSLSLAMMDIDHFKKFNDTYGHATGDDVLRLVAAVIKEQIRESVDIPGRFGGEEMLVLMPETDEEGAMVLAERLREAIASTDLTGPKGEILHVNVSIGVSTFGAYAKTPVELVEFADQALYASKRNGRNRVTRYGPDMGSTP
ncbi:diguanylate cyclase [bacterium]|nr:diguanylate cyclase [bacterium]